MLSESTEAEQEADLVEDGSWEVGDEVCSVCLLGKLGTWGGAGGLMLENMDG